MKQFSIRDYPDWNTDTNPLGGPRPGTTATLSLVGSNKVVLDFDFSANPVSASDSTPTNFYGLAFYTNQHLAGWKVEHTNIGQFHEVGSVFDQSETFMICNAGSGEYSCGETNSSSVGFGLTAVQSADYNLNGVVDAADYVKWRKNPSSYYGTPDGYLIWRANFASTAGSGLGSETSAVPEPASLLLISCAIALAFTTSMRRRSPFYL